jgi:hypothetical protein
LSLGGKSFQINRPSLYGKIACPQGFRDHIRIGFLIVKGNHQDVRSLRLMFLNPVNFLQDSPYPSVGASRKTSGHLQLHDSLRRTGRTDRQHQKQKYRNQPLHFSHHTIHDLSLRA